MVIHSPIEEIKAKLDITDIIGTYVQLTRAGANFKARCPFHSEKSPSFMVSRAKQLWYCFGACQEGGDMFKFLMKIEGLDFPEALKLLADKTGVTLPRYDARAQSQKNELLEIVKKAAEFYAKELESPRGKLASDYLIKRGLSEAIIKQFSLGYAPDSWDALTLHLRDAYKAEEVFAAGLAIRRERGHDGTDRPSSSYYDRFRHRVMFPIRDIHGNTVGFTSRLLDATRQEGKYVNTPETPIYSKGRTLYGLDLAREPIRKQDYAIVVEGNMDVIACHQFGMVNVVAASGTALTIEQVRLLKRYSGNLMVCFDADAAGEHAAKRGIDLALAEGMRVKVVRIPEGAGKDPDECVRQSIKIWEGAVRGAQEIMEYYLERTRARFNVGTAHGRAQFVNALLREIVKLPDLVERDFWMRKISEAAHLDERVLREQLSGLKGQLPQVINPIVSATVPQNLKPEIVREPRPRSEILSERLLALFPFAPNCAPAIIGAILPEMLAGQIHRELYTKLVFCYTAYNSHHPANDGDNFRQFWRNFSASAGLETLSTGDRDSRATLDTQASILELYGDKEFEHFEPAQFERETLFLIGEIRREHIRRRRSELAEQMRQAEYARDPERVSELAREFESLAEA